MRAPYIKRLWLSLLCLSLFALACQLTSPASTSTPTLDKTATNEALETELTIDQQQTLQDIQDTMSAEDTETAMPTATPIDTPTPLPTDTPESTATPTPAPVATLNANANLRAGPGVVYAVVVSLTLGTEVQVIAKDTDSSWLNVTDEKSGQSGWISVTLVTYTFDLDSIPVADVIPPTPTFAPVVPDTPTASLAMNVHIAVTDSLEVPVTVYLDGPYTTSFTVGAGSTITVTIPEGTYSYTASAYGYEDLTGTKSWSAGDWTWEFSPA